MEELRIQNGATFIEHPVIGYLFKVFAGFLDNRIK